MERESSWIEAAQGLADAIGRGEVCRVEARGLSDAERGWSGAEVVRGEAVLSDGSRMPLILKCAERKERCAMARLTRQRQCVPASFSGDLDGAAPAWMAMEDLGRQRLAPPDDRAFLRRFAIALASIHARDLDRGTEMPWLPAAGADHWRRVVSELSVDHFERKLHESDSFCAGVWAVSRAASRNGRPVCPGDDRAVRRGGVHDAGARRFADARWRARLRLHGRAAQSSISAFAAMPRCTSTWRAGFQTPIFHCTTPRWPRRGSPFGMPTLRSARGRRAATTALSICARA